MGSLVYSIFCKVLDYLQIDDPLDAFQVHGACGFLGCLCVALFEKDVGVFYDSEKGWK
jgi:ammonia channel protein AmtB